MTGTGSDVQPCRQGVQLVLSADNHNASGLPGAAVEQRGQPMDQMPGPARQLLDGGLRFAVLGVDHHDDRGVAVQHAHRGLVVADDRSDGAGQHVAGVVQADRNDVVESSVGERFDEQRRFRGGFVAPGDADDVQSLIQPGRGEPERPVPLRWPVRMCKPPVRRRRGARRNHRGRGWRRRRRGPPPGPSRLTSMSATAQVPCPNLHLNRGPMPVRRTRRT